MDADSKSSYLYENLPVQTKDGHFAKETNTSGYIVIWTIYTAHTYYFTSHYTVFEFSAACLSVIFGYFPVYFR